MKHGIHKILASEELEFIRHETIGRSDFKIEDRCLLSDESDRVGLNLGHYENGELLAALRSLPVLSFQDLDKNLDYKKTETLNLKYPGVVFGKAGTLLKARGSGLMRELYLKMVELTKEQKFNFIALTTKPSNPLNDFLLEEGFERKINSEGWHRYGYESGGETLVFLKRLIREGE